MPAIRRSSSFLCWACDAESHSPLDSANTLQPLFNQYINPAQLRDSLAGFDGVQAVPNGNCSDELLRYGLHIHGQ
ncbi:hypothetical protein [cf. Phormidesmis sp. LEGE 11477]|uniref:hypothetical protein n=1 Tax=cf. Phormidesmis sp. LEGE 11477 TaxID=1828680 RepID=UPI00187FBA1D|nr:hypothetical protein [cf. Phormidesmis sp. LEGE 11477]MBE9064942.1 hypothetical protein [cf. Phormidesmis sp. LEGE 11477]